MCLPRPRSPILPVIPYNMSTHIRWVIDDFWSTGVLLPPEEAPGMAYVGKHYKCSRTHLKDSMISLKFQTQNLEHRLSAFEVFNGAAWISEARTLKHGFAAGP